MKIIKSFSYAWRGLIVAIKEQLNLRVQLLAAIVAIIAGIYFKITSTEWILLLITIGLVISLELVNSSIENLTDLVTLERNPLAGKVKDIAAASVMISSIVAMTVGFIIFSKYVF